MGFWGSVVERGIGKQTAGPFSCPAGSPVACAPSLARRRRRPSPRERLIRGGPVQVVARMLQPLLIVEDDAMRRLLTTFALLAALSAGPAAAQSFRAAIVFEPSTGTVLYRMNANQQLPTASMIKMLNALVVMDALDAGEVQWNTPIRASRAAAMTEGSQVYLEQGEVFTVHQLMEAMLVKSANDAAAALAEGVAGSQEAFVGRMREKALAMGLRNTVVHTPHGLPTNETGLPEDESTPWDLARMGAAVLEHPELRLMAGTRLAPFRNGEFQLFNPNRLLGRYAFATGVKTGYHAGSDFCVTASARRDGMELIAVVMGAPHRTDRFSEAERLLEEAFADYRLVVPVRAGEVLAQHASVTGGRWSGVPVRVSRDVRMVVAKDEPLRLQRFVDLDRRPAPVDEGAPVGRVLLRLDDRVIATVPVVAAADVPRASPWQLWRRQVVSTILATFALLRI
jgi:D-alanyl-D-alanine carboxypeptidase (penicillin-binding protein 5/6)